MNPTRYFHRLPAVAGLLAGLATSVVSGAVADIDSGVFLQSDYSNTLIVTNTPGKSVTIAAGGNAGGTTGQTRLQQSLIGAPAGSWGSAAATLITGGWGALNSGIPYDPLANVEAQHNMGTTGWKIG